MSTEDERLERELLALSREEETLNKGLVLACCWMGAKEEGTEEEAFGGKSTGSASRISTSGKGSLELDNDDCGLGATEDEADAPVEARFGSERGETKKMKKNGSFPSFVQG
jgi:hypothetical protein